MKKSLITLFMLLTVACNNEQASKLLDASNSANNSNNSNNDNNNNNNTNPPPASNIDTSTKEDICGAQTFTSDLFIADKRILEQNSWGAADLGGARAASFDEQIKKIEDKACRGTGVWQITNKVTSGGFGNQTCSPALSQTAGESSLRSTNGGDTMEVSFYFKTINDIADGSALEVDLANVDCSDRFNYLKFINSDDANGFQIFGYDGVDLEVLHSIDNISRGEWHRIKIVSQSIDGLNSDNTANNIIKVYLDGVLKFTYSDWEEWRATLPSPSYAVSRVMFRLRTVSTDVNASFLTPGGFYIDDFIQKIYNSNNPSNIISEYKTGFEVQ